MAEPLTLVGAGASQLRYCPVAVRLQPGTRVGPYEVIALVGAGGMAEVYRARDARLHRDVALKVISEAFGGDAALLERFEREARLAGSLNHPNVVALEERTISLGDPTGVLSLFDMKVTPDGGALAFDYQRTLG